MINDEDAPTGRPAGELGWAGLANLFYRIDRQNGVGGFWATQILPFADPASFTAYMDFETAVYDHVRSGSLAATWHPLVRDRSPVCASGSRLVVGRAAPGLVRCRIL